MKDQWELHHHNSETHPFSHMLAIESNSVAPRYDVILLQYSLDGIGNETFRTFSLNTLLRKSCIQHTNPVNAVYCILPISTAQFGRCKACLGISWIPNQWVWERSRYAGHEHIRGRVLQSDWSFQICTTPCPQAVSFQRLSYFFVQGWSFPSSYIMCSTSSRPPRAPRPAPRCSKYFCEGVKSLIYIPDYHNCLSSGTEVMHPNNAPLPPSTVRKLNINSNWLKWFAPWNSKNYGSDSSEVALDAVYLHPLCSYIPARSSV